MPRHLPLGFVGGATIGFDLGTGVLDQLADRMAFALADSPLDEPTANYRRFPAGIERHDPLRSPDPVIVGSTLDHLIDDLHLTIALHATDDVFVHAGVVEWGGTAIVVPGRSHAGKSRLVHSMVRAGARYLSDEYARITPEGQIAPYPRPIQLRTPSGRQLVSPDTIGEVAAVPCPPGLLLLTSYVEGSRFEPQAVAPAQAALDLLDNTVIADIDHARAAAAVAVVARRAVAQRSVRPGADHTVRAILALADRVRVAA